MIAGYLNEGGKLNLKRFEKFMDAMSEIDRELFREKYQDLMYMESKRDDNETFGNEMTEITAQTKNDLDELIKKTVSYFQQFFNCKFICKSEQIRLTFEEPFEELSANIIENFYS